MKGDASELLAKKADLEKQKTTLQADVDARRIALEKKANSVGNIVDKSVPISDNEVICLTCCSNVRMTTLN